METHVFDRTHPLFLDHRREWWGGKAQVGIAARYGLDGLGIETRWRRDLPHPSSPALEPTQPPVQLVTGSLSRGQSCEGVAFTTNPHLAPRLKKEYSYTSTSPLGLHGLF